VLPPQALTSAWAGVGSAAKGWKTALERQLVKDATDARNGQPPAQ
jgi:hypothetical protein